MIIIFDIIALMEVSFALVPKIGEHSLEIGSTITTHLPTKNLAKNNSP